MRIGNTVTFTKFLSVNIGQPLCLHLTFSLGLSRRFFKFDLDTFEHLPLHIFDQTNPLPITKSPKKFEEIYILTNFRLFLHF